MGGPQCFIAGDNISNGQQVGALALSPLPYGWSPTLQSASERGTKCAVAYKWAHWIHHLCHLVDPPHLRAGEKISTSPHMGGVVTSPLLFGGSQRFRAGDKISSGPQVGRLGTPPLPSWGPQRFKVGTKIRSGPQVGGFAPSPLPSRGPQHFRAGDKISSGGHKWKKLILLASFLRRKKKTVFLLSNLFGRKKFFRKKSFYKYLT